MLDSCRDRRYRRGAHCRVRAGLLRTLTAHAMPGTREDGYPAFLSPLFTQVPGRRRILRRLLPATNAPVVARHTCYSDAFGYGDGIPAMYAGSGRWWPCELDARSIGDDTPWGLEFPAPGEQKGECMSILGVKRCATLLAASVSLALIFIANP